MALGHLFHQHQERKNGSQQVGREFHNIPAVSQLCRPFYSIFRFSSLFLFLKVVIFILDLDQKVKRELLYVLWKFVTVWQ